jgi:hypothetical protein
LSTTETALTAHLVVERFPADNQIIETINKKLYEEFEIVDPTIQLELAPEMKNCDGCP